MYRIRRVEEKCCEVYASDKIQSPIHLSIGQELASVAVCAALRKTDKVFGSYRSHALYLAKGGKLRAFVAELYGKSTGCARGKGGSMHLVEPEAGLLGTSAIVGSLIPVATGYAWAQKLKGSSVVTVCFFGDGATEEGCYFEALNFAALHSLPILFVCENNGYAIHTPLTARQSTSITSRAQAIGVPAISTMTYEGTMRAAESLVDRVASGYGATLLEVRAPRMKEHVGPGEDWGQGYRKRETEAGWTDPVECAEQDLDGPAVAARIRAEVDAEVAFAFAFAAASPYPGPEELMEHLHG